MHRTHNFSAGPAALPTEVLQQAAEEMLDYRHVDQEHTANQDRWYPEGDPVDSEEPQIEVPKPTQIKITGIDKQRVGQIASEIRSFRKPEPFKGKGVKYKEEISCSKGSNFLMKNLFQNLV